MGGTDRLLLTDAGLKVGVATELLPRCIVDVTHPLRSSSAESEPA